jgi:Coenzyme PQQ synthesis protein D (PqqD)
VSAPSYRRRADVPWRRSLNAVLCLPPGAPEPVTLAGTRPEVWDLLEHPCALDELAAELAQRHGIDAQIDAQIVARGVKPLLDHLAALGLVVAVL